MRIIKGGPTAMLAIAGEIVNIESSELIYVDGVMVANREPGYPQIVRGTVRNVIRAAGGCIIVPRHVDIATFMEELLPLVEQLSERAGVALIPHTVEGDRVTNVKVLTKQSISQILGPRENRPRAVTKRVFRPYADHTAIKARFDWQFVDAVSFDLSIYPTGIQDAISRLACSVFYDPDDICSLPHNTVTMEFSERDMRMYASLTDRMLYLDRRIDVVTANAPHRHHPSSLQEIPSYKLFAAAITDIVIEPSDDGVLRCQVCRREICGEFYAMEGILNDPNRAYAIPHCAICGHNEKQHEPYMRVLRIDSGVPRETVIDLIDDPVTRDIVVDATRGWRYIDGGIILIGNKYLGMNRKSYLFGRIPPIAAGRKHVEITQPSC